MSDKKEFEIYFTAKTTVKAYTEGEAIAKVQKTKNIKNELPIKIQPWYERLGYGFLINIGTLFTLFVMIIVIKAWADIINLMQTLPEPFDILGTLMMFIFIMASLRFPKTIGGWFGKITNKSERYMEGQ